MRSRNCPVLLSLLASVGFIISGAPGALAQEQAEGPSAVSGGPWSDPSTWSGAAVPADGVTVSR